MWLFKIELPKVKYYGSIRSKYVPDNKLVTSLFGSKAGSNRQSEKDATDTSVHD